MSIPELHPVEKDLIERRRVVLPKGERLLVFAYGSLMWRPGFSFSSACKAKASGYHRSFCVKSTHYRGSEDWPGLVLGLDRGGTCNGVLYDVAPEMADDVLTYLHEREMLTSVYEPRWISLIAPPHGQVRALAYVVDRCHRQYAGKLTPLLIAERIAHAVGMAGSNQEYLMNTLCHLRELGIKDPALERVAALLRELP